MYRKSLFALIATVMLFLATSPAEAESGFYMGLGAAYNTIQGDFDGVSGLGGGTEDIIIPDLNNAVGIDLLLGQQMLNNVWAIEFNYMSSGHNGTWMGRSGDVSYSAFSINGKYSFLPASRVRPYLLFGVSYNGLIIKKGAIDIYTGAVADAKLFGTGLNLGAGIDNYLSPIVSLTLGIMYRYLDYTEAKGVHQRGTIDDSLDGSGFSLLLTTAYHF